MDSIVARAERTENRETDRKHMVRRTGVKTRVRRNACLICIRPLFAPLVPVFGLSFVRVYFIDRRRVCICRSVLGPVDNDETVYTRFYTTGSVERDPLRRFFSILFHLSSNTTATLLCTPTKTTLHYSYVPVFPQGTDVIFSSDCTRCRRRRVHYTHTHTLRLRLRVKTLVSSRRVQNFIFFGGPNLKYITLTSPVKTFRGGVFYYFTSVVVSVG